MHGHLNVNLSRCTVTWRSIYHDARSPEGQFITMHGQLKVNLSRCTVTWRSIYHDARSPEGQFITMQGHLNANLSRCTVTWRSIYHDARSPECQFITMHGHLNVDLSRCTVTWRSNWSYNATNYRKSQFKKLEACSELVTFRFISWASPARNDKSQTKRRRRGFRAYIRT